MNLHCLNHPTTKTVKALLVCLLFSISFLGCASLMSSATSEMMTHLSDTIKNNNDLKTVEDGAPAYLLMIDSLIRKDPDNIKLLYTAANLYGSYSDLFIKDPVRSKRFAQKSMNFANQALCLSDQKACDLKSKPFEAFTQIVNDIDKDHLPALYSLGNAWSKWILANSDDFDAIADLSYIEHIMKRVIQMDDTYMDGAAYVYLGTLSSLLPQHLGGAPEKGKAYYEKALSISHGKNLMVKVLYAKFYSRIIYDRQLHDQLLNDVMKADPQVQGYTLINTFAKVQAKELLADADDYF